MTNADKIRNMNDEELEKLLNKAVFCGVLACNDENSNDCKACDFPFCRSDKYIGWLKQEA